MTAVTAPECRDTLIYVKDRYVVKNEDETYTYYKYKPGSLRHGNNYLEIDSPPPVLKEGFASYKNQLFKVSLRDLLRRQVNVSSAKSESAATTTTTTKSSPGRAKVAVGKFATVKHELTTEQRTGVSEEELTDLAWQEQVNSLLYISDPEEEWDF